jgi:hypothetical protein
MISWLYKKQETNAYYENRGQIYHKCESHMPKQDWDIGQAIWKQNS